MLCIQEDRSNQEEHLQQLQASAESLRGQLWDKEQHVEDLRHCDQQKDAAIQDLTADRDKLQQQKQDLQVEM